MDSPATLRPRMGGHDGEATAADGQALGESARAPARRDDGLAGSAGSSVADDHWFAPGHVGLSS
jgi:hypothetical protein